MPSACLKKAMTTTILVKLVIIIKMAGARVSTVRSMTILTTLTTSSGFCVEVKPKLTVGKVTPPTCFACANAGVTSKAIKINNLKLKSRFYGPMDLSITMQKKLRTSAASLTFPVAVIRRAGTCRASSPLPSPHQIHVEARCPFS